MDEQKREITVAVATRIKYFRRVKLLSQEELALRADINPAYFGQVERGLKCPTIDTLYKIAKALDVPPSELLRTEVLPGHITAHGQRAEALLARVPAEKLEQVLTIMEDVVALL